MEPVATFSAITIDCRDPDMLAEFWRRVFATQIESTSGDPTHYIDLLPAAGSPIIRFQRVPEGKSVKNRLHLDIEVKDDLAEAVGRLEELGAARRSDALIREYGWEWQTMLDPEGNEFCVCRKEG